MDAPVQLSVLDRLLGGGRAGVRARSSNRLDSVAELKASVLRDLDWLLNTRRIAEPASEDFPEVRRSVYHFGIPDVTSRSGDSPDLRRRLIRDIQESIELFEPRLTRVKVTLKDGGEDGWREMRFSVEGYLDMDPEPERIAFDTVLEVASGEFDVEAGRA